jgi:ABC-type nitrate/sulfonate/bicarbonate transport system substrate-binding protein
MRDQASGHLSMTWPAGGDALVVNPLFGRSRLRGKSIAIQAFDRTSITSKILADAGLTPRDVTLKWVPDLTGTKNSPAAAMRAKEVDAALVIIPDAMALTSNGTVGTGAEDSVKGARILLSTKTANRIIADVYAVRSDYLAANRDAVERFVRGLIQGEEEGALVATKAAGAAASSGNGRGRAVAARQCTAIADTEGMYADHSSCRLPATYFHGSEESAPRRATERRNPASIYRFGIAS